VHPEFRHVSVAQFSVRRLDSPMSQSNYDEILAKQLAMNRQTWAALQSQLRLEFSYDAPSREAAESMVALIKEQTDYEVRAESSGSFLRRKWRVEGTTQKTAASAEMLDQWVTWMVTAGKERACDFDGWGTAV
jgi:hypothetical protein